MSYDAVGRRYARALFELGKEEGSLSGLSTAFASIAQAYQGSAELREVLDNPLVPEEKREAILIELAEKIGAGDTAKRALRLIARHRRLRALADISRHLARVVDDDAKIVRAEVISAAPLSEAYLARLKAEIEKATGSKVTVETSVDPSLIAGVITKIGDRVVDGSALTRLRSLRSSTTELS